MRARNLEWAILKAVARVSNDEWLPCSLGDLRNRLREVDPEAGNVSLNSIAEASISLYQEGHLLLGKVGGVRRDWRSISRSSSTKDTFPTSSAGAALSSR